MIQEPQASLVVRQLQWSGRGIIKGYRVEHGTDDTDIGFGDRSSSSDMNLFVSRAFQTIEVAEQNQQSWTLDRDSLGHWF